MTAAIRKQIQRSHLKQGGGKRLDMYLSADELRALDSYRMAMGLRYPADAIKAMIRAHAQGDV